MRSSYRIALLTTACTATYLVISLTSYAQYLSTGYDLGIFDQVVRAYSHFQAPIAPVKAPGFNILGDHFHPILALLAPLYWIWDNPSMLLIAQAVLMGAAVPFVYRFACRHGATERYALIVAGVYGLGWPLWSMANFDFHEIAFAVPLLAAAVDALDRRAFRTMMLCSFCLLFVKEDLGIVVIALGITAAWVHRSHERGVRIRGRLAGAPPAIAYALIVMGLAGYLVATKIVIPHFAPGHAFVYWQYGSLGHNAPDALWSILTRPWHAAWVFVTPSVKFITLMALLAPLLFIPLRSPYLIVAAPLLAERFYNARDQLWSTHEHYNALPWLALVFAFVDGAARMHLFDETARAQHRRTLVAIYVIITQELAVASSVAIEQAIQPGGGLPSRLTHWDSTQVSDRRSADAFLPADVCVGAENFLIPHITSKDYVTLPGAPNFRPDFLALDLGRKLVGPSQTQVGKDGPHTKDVYNQAVAAGFTTVFRRDQIVVLQSPDYRGPSRECRPLGPGHPVP